MVETNVVNVVCNCSRDTFQGWLTAIGTIGACLIAGLAFAWDKIKMLFRKPKLNISIHKFDEMPSSEMGISGVKVKSGISFWIEVKNNGKAVATSSQLECDAVYEKIENSTMYAAKPLFVPKEFPWRSNAQSTSILPGVRSWAMLLTVTDIQEAQLSDCTPSNLNDGHMWSVRIATGNQFGDRFRCSENTAMLHFVLHYDGQEKIEQFFAEFHWPDKGELTASNCWCKYLTECEGKDKIDNQARVK